MIGINQWNVIQQALQIKGFKILKKLQLEVNQANLTSKEGRRTYYSKL